MMTRQKQISFWIVVIFMLLLSTRWAKAEGKDFSGRWETNYGIMTLEQVGESVSGYYIMKYLHCSIEGEVKDGRFHFKYREPKTSGEGWFALNSSGDQFSGWWREYDKSRWLTWSGRRNPALTSPIPGFDIRFTSGKSALAIPFELDNGHIFLRVSVNGSSPLSLILDTGGSSLYPKLSLRNAESLRMKLKPLGVKNGGVGSEFPDVYLVTDTTSFNLPGVVLSSRAMFAISTDKVNECLDRATHGRGEKRVLDGIIGRGFFSSFVVEIDYAARLINLYDPLSYKYRGKGNIYPLEIEPQSGLVFVRAQVKAPERQPVMARLIVDTGASTALTLNKQFAEAHKILPPAEKLTATNECGIGGWAEGTSVVGTLEALQLGDIKLSNPLTFFRKNLVGQGYDGLLGGGALRNFKVIFDFSRSLMILEPSH
jgi:predicted aspartyl protease